MRGAAFAALTSVLALSLSAPAHAAGAAALDAVPTAKITLEVIAAAGSGCAPGTATVVANSDNTGFRIKYTEFLAEAGGTASLIDSRKNCQIGVLVTVPAGWTFAIAEANYRGRAKLAAGATGLQRTNYYWQGSSENNATEQQFTGPLNTTWSAKDVAPALVYTPCGGQKVLNINTELRVDEGTSTSKSSLSMRSSDGDVDTLFNLSWAEC
ncbi:MAG TPA: DUF4360 domain-containing protein [Actinoplanes sp.]